MECLNTVLLSTMLATLCLLLPSASDSVGSFTLHGVKPDEYHFETVCLE